MSAKKNAVPKIPVHPGRVLFSLAEKKALSFRAIALGIGVSRQCITQIANCKQSLTTDICIRLGLFFEVDPRYWVNLQVDYDLYFCEIKYRVVYKKIKNFELG